MESRGGATSAQLVRTGHRVPILYGRLYFSPDIVRVQQISDTPKLYGVISEGPIEEIESITGGVDAGDYLVTSLGSLTPTAAIGTWSIGLACFVGDKIDGPSPVYVMAKGRTPYDPRLGAWGAGELPDEDFCVYSTNPALIMADLLCFPQYGLDGVLPSAVVWSTVEDAADWCDELISSVKRYEIGGLRVAEAGTNRDWMDTVGLHAGLRWCEVAGLWYLDFDDGAATSEATVTEDFLIEGSRPSVRYGAGSGLSGQPNRFTAEWTKVSGGGYTVETAVVTVTHASVNAGAAIRESSVYRLHGFQNEAQAKRALERIAAEIWSEVEIDLSLTLDFLHLGIGSRFTTNLPSLGLIGVDWRVTRIAYDADSVRLTAKLYAGDTWTAADEEDLASPSPVGANDPLQGYLPSPPPPGPVAALTAPAVLAPPSLGLVPVYRAIAEDPAPEDGEVATWDAATKTVRFVAGGTGGGGSPLTVKESDGTPSVASVTEMRFSGATVAEVSTGVVEITVSAGSPGSSPVLGTDVFTATAAQTAFILTFEPLSGGIVYVSRDGVVAREADWSLTGSTVTFGVGLDAGTEVQIVYWRTAPTGAAPAMEGFSASEGQEEFTLAHVAGTVLVVSINGVVQRSTAWSIVGGSTLTFTTGLVLGDDVWISYLY